jgi:cell division protein FtsZ
MESDRIETATRSLNEMTSVCDTIILIDNNKFIELEPRLPMAEAFSLADQTMAGLIEGIVESISLPNLVNLNLADFRNIVGKGGLGMVGIGQSAAPAPDRAEEAVRSALGSPLFDADFAEAKGALIHVSGGPSMTVEEAGRVGQVVSDMIGHEARVGWGANVDPSIKDGLKVTIVMTGMRAPRLLSGLESTASALIDIESSFSSREKPLQIDLGLDQIETLED